MTKNKNYYTFPMYYFFISLVCFIVVSIHATSLYIILCVILCENKLIIFVCHKVLFFYFLLCVP